MKKLILLLLVLVGGVITVQADNVTKRIYVITDANFQTYQGDGLAVHAWYTDNSGDLYNQGNTNEKMATFEGFNPSDAKGIWFKDITFDNAKTIKFFVYKYNDHGWHSSDATQKELNSASTCNYYSWDSNNNGALALEGQVTYYSYLYDGSEWTKQELTTTDGVTYTTTIDNQTTFKSGLEMIIAPSLAFMNDFAVFKWHMMFRPYAENMELGFSVQTNLGGGCYGGNNTNSIKLNTPSYYDLSFMPFDWKYSLSPYFTRTINGAESNGKYYATFSSDYDVAVPTGITAYYGDIKDESKVIMTSFGEGVGIASTDAAFLEVNSASDTYTFTPATSTRSGSNLMKKPAGGVTPEGAYVFANKSAGVGFYKTTTDLNNQQGKAYLGIESSAPSFSIEIEGETTGIKVINFNEDNNLNNGQMFDLQGRRIADPTKGVYIVNGKKVIIK